MPQPRNHLQELLQVIKDNQNVDIQITFFEIEQEVDRHNQELIRATKEQQIQDDLERQSQLATIVEASKQEHEQIASDIALPKISLNSLLERRADPKHCLLLLLGVLFNLTAITLLFNTVESFEQTDKHPRLIPQLLIDSSFK